MHDTYDTADEMEIIDYNIQPPEDHVGDLPHPGLLDDQRCQFGRSRRSRGHSLVRGIPPYASCISLERAFLYNEYRLNSLSGNGVHY